MWLILEIASRRERLLLALDMTEALRPSELFALRWRSFDDLNTLDITETVRPHTRPSMPGVRRRVLLEGGLSSDFREFSHN